MSARYNEIDAVAAHVMRELITAGVIASGIVIEKSIKELTADDVRGHEQVHLFAGGGLWSVAARLAGWPDHEPFWTASCPCQPFSQAGKGLGYDDPRDLWPDVVRLLDDCRRDGYTPPCIVGEQVGGKTGVHWFNRVRVDLEARGYEARMVEIPACAVDAPHIRNRIYWVAVAHADFAFGRIGDEQSAGKFALDEQDARNAVRPGSRNESYWSDAEWIVCHDGKARRTKPGLRLLVDGLPGRVDIWRIAGNAISPVLAAEVLAALREALGRVNSSERDE